MHRMGQPGGDRPRRELPRPGRLGVHHRAGLGRQRRTGHVTGMATQRFRERGSRRRRGGARGRVEAAELRQGAVPRRLPARPDPPAAAARPGSGREGRALPRRAARVPRRAGRPARDRARREDPRRRDRRAQGARRARHEDARRSTAGSGSRRSTTTGRWRSPASGTRRCRTLLSAHQSIGVAEPLRLFGTEEQKREWLPLVATDHISRVPAHRARRRLRPGARSATDAPTPDRGRRRATASTAASCGRPTARSPTSSS